MEETKLPEGVQAAIDAGDPDEVQRLLTPVPEGMSKAVQKKLIKQADIKKKALAKGKGTSATQSPAAAAKPAATTAKQPDTLAESPPAPAPGTVSSQIGAKALSATTSALLMNEDEEALVADFLASIKLPDEAMAALRQQQHALCMAIGPRLNALQNRAYAQGFHARAGVV
eukprot:CAMPEP_0119310542 /NCGR_PEP_ID=MMETSP1333-20130426/19627_1 /TAXON_ID=418940 /ORGANISM="Scyphosphaera apsteinii, Strain RCC1455" /LENGTH=170 /DNA_ID=CAMNT_0007314741 /DNA_START=88 /DNA_END=600 /DNA_ORIENTATION=+